MSEDQEHELLDRDLRPFVEECDQMQGFQIITGADDAWAGFASKYLEGLRDEFGRKSVWVWGLEEARQAGRVSNFNIARSHLRILLITSLWLGKTSPATHQHVAVFPDSCFSSLALYFFVQHSIWRLTVIPQLIHRLRLEYLGFTSRSLRKHNAPVPTSFKKWPPRYNV